MPEKSRNWCFTLNRPTNACYPETWTLTNVKMLIYQLEMGEEGTLHLQGYVELIQPRALTALKKLSAQAHWEQRRGSRKQAVLYVVKEETRISPPCLYWEKEWVSPDNENLKQISEWLTSIGINLTRGDGLKPSALKQRLEEIKDKLQDSSSSIEEVADESFDLWVRYYKAFERYITMKTKPRSSDVEVIVIQGPTGTGKSRWCLSNYPDAYWKQRSLWWDGYFKHETVILDEFYGWLPFDLLLRVCDRYPMLVETKGGQMQFVATRIIITTNHPPSTWYKSAYFPAFVRRVSKWIVMPLLDIVKEYENYEEAMVEMNKNILQF